MKPNTKLSNNDYFKVLYTTYLSLVKHLKHFFLYRTSFLKSHKIKTTLKNSLWFKNNNKNHFKLIEKFSQKRVNQI